MGHRRNPSEGLNIGEGFPTTYSSFAISADSRQHDGSRSSSTQAKRSSASLKRRTSPPLVSLKELSLLRGSSTPGIAVTPATPSKVTFDSSSDVPVSTQKSWETTVKGFYKRWKFVVFFLAFCALLVCGTLLPVSRTQSPISKGKTGGQFKRDNLLQPVRATRDIAPLVQAEHQAVTNRFARWAQALLGSASDGSAKLAHPVAIPAGLGDLEMPDDLIMAADPDPDIVLMAEKAIADRRAAKWAARWAKNKKRRTVDDAADEADKGAREHPSRAARRQKLAATQEASVPVDTGKKQIKNGVFERIAKVFQAQAAAHATPSQADASENWKKSSGEGDHILDTWGASHPELIDMDGGYAGF
jgi:hypothetical protein